MEWIKVSEKFPEPYQRILAYSKDGIKFSVYGNPDHPNEFLDPLSTLYRKPNYPVTHWMPLPKPPQD